MFKTDISLKICVLTLLLAFCGEAFAASVKIHGKLTDENNEPLEFASVRVEGTAIGATSGLDGMYTLSAPESDTIRVIFTCIGYEDARRRLVDAKGDVTLNVKMTPAT